MNKKILLVLCCTFVANISLFSQKSKDNTPETHDNWYLKKKSKRIYAIDVDGAYKLLSKRKSTPIVVCVLDGGTEVNHPDLKEVIWKNTGEIPNNNLDDDNNGYVDDTCGWNFIGGKDTCVKYDNYEWVREYGRLKAIYEDVDCETFGGDEAKKKECEKCEKYRSDVKQQVDKFKKSIETNKEYIVAAKSIKNRTGKENPTLEDINKVKAKTNEESWVQFLCTIYMSKDIHDFNYVMKQFTDGIEENKAKINYQYNPDYDPRSTIVGDTYLNTSNRFYGNNNVEGPDGSHGSHVAGIIAATRHNSLGIDGVADNAKIMVVRVVPDGDERDKDVANGIRYAVDNGAKIINMSFGKSVSFNKPYVDSAVKYAESKGVLLIHAAGNSAQNNDEVPNYPNDSIAGTEDFAKNWIEVGASTENIKKLAAIFSNYGKANVDVFAPGVNIWSSVPDAKYDNYQGTSMASPVCAGVAALVWSYFPSLTWQEVKEIIIQSAAPVNSKVILPSGNDYSKSQINFKELSATGGVINAKKAIQLAIAKTGVK